MCAHTHFRISSKWLDFRELHNFSGSSSAGSKVAIQLFSAILLSPVSISQMEWKKFLNVCVWLYIRNKIWTLITIIGFPLLLENIFYFKTNTCVTSCQMPFFKSTSHFQCITTVSIVSVNFFGSLLQKHSTHLHPLGYISLENPLLEYSSLAQILWIFQSSKMKC